MTAASYNTGNVNNVTSIENAGNHKGTENPTSEEELVVKSNSKDIGVNTSIQDETSAQHIVVVTKNVGPRLQGKATLVDLSDEELDHLGNIRPSGIITASGDEEGTIHIMGTT